MHLPRQQLQTTLLTYSPLIITKICTIRNTKRNTEGISLSIARCVVLKVNVLGLSGIQFHIERNGYESLHKAVLFK
jgi:hypothetical protein